MMVINNGLKLAMIMIATSMLTSCGGMSKSDCSSDWKERGRKDGAEGLPSETGLKYQKSCADKVEEFPIAEYKAGWLVGIESYCSPQKAYDKGVKDKDRNSEVCPIEFRSTYDKNYERGQNFSKTQEEIKDVKKEIKDLENKKSNYKSKISDTDDEMDSLESKTEKLKSRLQTIEAKASEVKLERVETEEATNN